MLGMQDTLGKGKTYNRLKKSGKRPIRWVSDFNIRKNPLTSFTPYLKCPAYLPNAFLLGWGVIIRRAYYSIWLFSGRSPFLGRFMGVVKKTSQP